MSKRKSFSISDSLTSGLQETMSVAMQYAGDLRLEVLPVSQVELDADNPRELTLTLKDVLQGILPSDPEFYKKSQDKESLVSMAHSIEQEGLINPILVYKAGNKYRLLAGERRTLATVLAGKESIQARVLDKKPSPYRLSLLQWIENIEREDLSLHERLRNLEKIIQAFASQNQISFDSVTATQISKIIGCSVQHAMNYKSVLLATPTLQALITQKQINNLEKAALLATIADTDLQKDAITACLAGATLGRLRALVKAAKPSKSVKNIPRNQFNLNSAKVGFNLNTPVLKHIVESSLKAASLTSVWEQSFAAVQWNHLKYARAAFNRMIVILEDHLSNTKSQ